jgi:hypothetical protein
MERRLKSHVIDADATVEAGVTVTDAEHARRSFIGIFEGCAYLLHQHGEVDGFGDHSVHSAAETLGVVENGVIGRDCKDRYVFVPWQLP